MTQAPRPGPSEAVARADAVVVGAGPGGAAAATLLARAGHDVVLVDKESFPRDKVCGDGLTPGAVAALRRLGLIDMAQGTASGWRRQQGLRIHGRKAAVDLPWPGREGWPAHSLTATRSLLDHTLVRRAVEAGAQLWEQTTVTAPVFLTAAQRRVAGVAYRRADGATGVVRAPLVVAADGAGSSFATRLGLRRLPSRPMGVAIRAYHRSPRSASRLLEVFVEVRRDGAPMPAYGWVFPLDGGLVNVGWVLLNATGGRRADYRATLTRWVGGLPPEWEITPQTMVGRPRSAALPMAFNRKPAVHKGVLLVGDAGGMINPFTGEGIRYAVESAAFAAEAADAALRARSSAPLATYARTVARHWGSYYTLGRGFVDLVSRPALAQRSVDRALGHPALMRMLVRLMVHVGDPASADLPDRVLCTMSRAVPAS